MYKVFNKELLTENTVDEAILSKMFSPSQRGIIYELLDNNVVYEDENYIITNL